jgi:chaperonin GroEL (HSP60 family)
VESSSEKLFGEGVRRTKGGEARRYNLLAARLIVDLIKNFLGPRGLEKMFIDILGEATITKHGATLLRKIDVDHPAAKVLIDASNAVDNEVGDGTTSVAILVGSLVEKAEQLLDMGIASSTVIAGYLKGLDFCLKILSSISRSFPNYDKEIMINIARTILGTKSISLADSEGHLIANLIVNAIYAIANFRQKSFEVDDIKIEEKIGNSSDICLIRGVVIDKSIDNHSMPKMVEGAKILVINEDLDNNRTKIEAQINITYPSDTSSYLQHEYAIVKSKTQRIIESGATVLISQKGIGPLAQYFLAKEGIISIRRVKENDILWISKATGASVTRDLDEISDNDLGYAEKVYEKFIGDDRMVFVDGCKTPESVTLLLRANSKRALDEYHRSVLSVIKVLRSFVTSPRVTGGGGATEAIIANVIRRESTSITGREQIVLQKFAEALEEIPITIARNSGMNAVDTMARLRSKYAFSSISKCNTGIGFYGIDTVQMSVQDVFDQSIIDVSIVKEQVIKAAVEVSNLLIRVDDVLMAKPVLYTHTHNDGTQHSHRGGDKKHDHYFDKLGKQQRPMHHYY